MWAGQQQARRIFDHPVMSMFLGWAPMALATIVHGFLVFGVDLFGPKAIEIARSCGGSTGRCRSAAASWSRSATGWRRS